MYVAGGEINFLPWATYYSVYVITYSKMGSVSFFTHLIYPQFHIYFIGRRPQFYLALKE